MYIWTVASMQWHPCVLSNSSKRLIRFTASQWYLESLYDPTQQLIRSCAWEVHCFDVTTKAQQRQEICPQSSFLHHWSITLRRSKMNEKRHSRNPVDPYNVQDLSVCSMKTSKRYNAVQMKEAVWCTKTECLISDEERQKPWNIQVGFHA